MQLEKETRRLVTAMHGGIDLAALCRATGLSQRWYYKFRADEGTRFSIDHVQRLHDYLVKQQRKSAA